MTLHSFAPVAGPDARVLILGSMPGGESLRQQQYYAHPRNAFWRIMGELFGFPHDLPYEERLEQLKRHHVALWDALSGCRRSGSLDSDIREPEPNDIAELLEEIPSIRTIGCNGTASWRFLKRFHSGLFPAGKWEIILLPSTSPAAAVYSYAQKLERWSAALKKKNGGVGGN